MDRKAASKPAIMFLYVRALQIVEAVHRGKRRRVVRVRWIVGRLERPQRQLDQDLLDSDLHAECRDLNCPRPNASHPTSR